MKNKAILLIILVIAVMIILVGLRFVFPKTTQELGVEINKPIAESAPEGGQKIPKEYKFEADSDLNSELENINPEVLDSDFSALKTLINNLDP